MSAEPERATAVGMVRAMRAEDVAAVTGILQESPEAANWKAQSLVDALQCPGAVALVWEAGGELLGFVMARQTAGEAEILNIAVKARVRRKGIGEALLGAAIKEFTLFKVQKIFLEVRESNAIAIRFYERAGFLQMGKRANYYREPEEAAVLMEKGLRTLDGGSV